MVKAKIKKTAFLILRVEESFKTKLTKKATELGESVSEFVRKVLMKRLK